MSQVTWAKLVRGRVYTYDGKTFEQGTWQRVTEDQKQHLEVHALDYVTVSSGERRVQETRDKFVFGVGTEDKNPDEYAEEQGQAARNASPRKRSR